MTRIGNFFFHYRNGLFPLAYLLLFAKKELVTSHYREMALAGLLIALSGQVLRAVTIGLDVHYSRGEEPAGLRGKAGDGWNVRALP